MGRKLFEMEQGDLLADLVDIPKKACDRRVRLYVSHFTLSSFSLVDVPKKMCFSSLFGLNL